PSYPSLELTTNSYVRAFNIAVVNHINNVVRVFPINCASNAL
uniref:Uncharacterized protein n=1 Tax=Ciona savignyi TaxID=51511 RepID=H2Z584_CIOSA